MLRAVHRVAARQLGFDCGLGRLCVGDVLAAARGRLRDLLGDLLALGAIAELDDLRRRRCGRGRMIGLSCRGARCVMEESPPKHRGDDDEDDEGAKLSTHLGSSRSNVQTTTDVTGRSSVSFAGSKAIAFARLSASSSRPWPRWLSSAADLTAPCSSTISLMRILPSIPSRLASAG